VAELRITVEGQDRDVESLRDWLRNEPEFRGHLRQGEAPSPDGAMGAVSELIVGVVSSGAATALARSLQVWLVQRRADIKLNIAGPQGRQIVLDAKRVADAEHLLKTALSWADNAPPESPAAG
jgi:Effector Associated Constant Component 1